MSDTTTQPAPALLQEIDRLVADAVSSIDECTCAGPPSVIVLRGFGRPSRNRADEVAAMLRARVGEVQVAARAVSLVATFGRDVVHRCAVVDVTGNATGGALMGWRWEAAEPGSGRLAVRGDDGEEVVLGCGQGLLVSPDHAHLELTTDPGTGPALCRATQVVVRQVDGRHLLRRDGTYVDEAPASVTVALGRPGIARRVH